MARAAGPSRARADPVSAACVSRAPPSGRRTRRGSAPSVRAAGRRRAGRCVVRRVVQGAALVGEALECLRRAAPVAASLQRVSPVAWCSASSPSARSAWSSSTAGAVPTSPPREVRRSTPSTRCVSSTKPAATSAAVDQVGAVEERPRASARAPTASPFHAVTTLSSRLGCGRCVRAASSRRARSGRRRPTRRRAWRIGQLQRRGAGLEGAVGGDAEQGRGARCRRRRRARRRAGRVSRRRSGPRAPPVSASSAEANPPSSVRRSRSRKSAVSSATRR